MTGSTGQLAQKLVELDGEGVNVWTLGRPRLDITNHLSVVTAIDEISPDIVVNAAAYTAVDKAESEKDEAFAVNRDGAASVAKAAASAGLPIIQISTDYVYSGDKTEPYDENDPTGPKSIYGKSKLEGEHLVAAANPRHIILRTAWVYSEIGTNFVKTMLRLAENKSEIAVVADQFGNPTSAADLASGVLRAAEMAVTRAGFDQYGVYHLCGTGRTNWADFARHVYSVSASLGGPSADVCDISTKEYPTAAARPLNSCLATDKYARQFGWTPPDWRQSAISVLHNLVGTPS